MKNLLLLFLGILADAATEKAEERAEERAPKSSVAIGIDLGTTFCCVGVYNTTDNKVTFRQFSGNHNTLPSTLYYLGYNKETNEPQFSVGYVAQADYAENRDPNRYFYGFKRLIGVPDFRSDRMTKDFDKKVTYPLDIAEYEGKRQTVVRLPIEDGKTRICPIYKLSASLLKDIRSNLGDLDTSNLVVTTPAYFDENQENDTRRAAAEAGFSKVTICKEPVAAAYAYQIQKFQKKDKKSEKFCVFDLGGGTLDISVVEADDDLLMVSKYVGDNYLGGENWNDNMVDHFVRELKEKSNVDISQNESTKLRLRLFAEKFKIELCTIKSSDKNVSHTDSFYYDDKNSHEFTMTREEFDKMNKPLYDRIRAILTGPMYGIFRKDGSDNENDVPVDRSEIDRVLLVGGSSRIPYITTLLSEIFDEKIIHSDLCPDTIVAEGAAYFSAGGANILPTESSLQLIDVAHLHYGICVNDDLFEAIIHKDSVLPIEVSKEFTTAYDNQSSVKIKVAQGYRPQFKHNSYIGDLDLEIKHAKPKGVPRIEVKIRMDPDYTLHVFATDLDTNTLAKTRFDRKITALSDEVRAKIAETARQNEESDRLFKLRCEALRHYENTVDGYKRRANNPGLSENVKSEIMTHCGAAMEWFNENKETASIEDINERIKLVEEAINEILDAEVKPEGEAKPETQPEKQAGREEL